MNEPRPEIELDNPTIDELIELIQSASSPLVDFQKDRLRKLIAQEADKLANKRVVAELRSLGAFVSPESQFKYKDLRWYLQTRVDELDKGDSQ